MKNYAKLILLFAVQHSPNLRVLPDSLVGEWRIAKPFVDMAPQPIGLNAKQERDHIGKRLVLRPTSIEVCGVAIRFTSVEARTFSAEDFLQSYKIRPDQIGLSAPVIIYSPRAEELIAICGSTEGMSIISDGHNAVLEDANDYFRLSKLGT